MSTQLQTLVQALEPDTLQVGSQGHSVRLLQLALNELELFDGDTDGCFGSDTALALQRLQSSFGLAETGKFDAATWYALSFWVQPTHQFGEEINVPSIWQWPFRKLRLLYRHLG
jgi:hypothetical protein